jgi:hypothetical protein
MKLTRVLLAVAALCAVAGVAYVRQGEQTAGQKMVAAAQRFLDSLSAEQKARAVFPFDSKERFNWNFVPLEKAKQSTRKGLPLKDMTAEQKKAAMALVAAGTSPHGHVQAKTIMSLESVLADLEKGKGPTRDPEWYFFTVFGTPGKGDKWGWRVEGHHLSLNFTLHGTEVVAGTPFLFAANPAHVQTGISLRTLPEAEDFVRRLVAALDKDQKKAAHRPGKGFPEPRQKETDAGVGDPAGLPHADMNPKQRAILMQLIEGFAGRMPRDVAEVELKRLRDAGVDKIHFVYTGSPDPGKGYTYRVHGPTFVIEFLNEQKDGAGNPANHIHSAWRRLPRDFGLDVK